MTHHRFVSKPPPEFCAKHVAQFRSCPRPMCNQNHGADYPKKFEKDLPTSTIRELHEPCLPVEDELNVYVIDDDEALRDSLGFLLGVAGFSVRVFDSASSFLDALHGIHSGCLITDIQMPGIDGLELLRRVMREKQRFL